MPASPPGPTAWSCWTGTAGAPSCRAASWPSRTRSGTASATACGEGALAPAFRYSRDVESPQEELAAAVAELRAYLSWAGEGGPVMVALPPPSTSPSPSSSPSHSSSPSPQMPKLPIVELDQVRAVLGECVRCKLH